CARRWRAGTRHERPSRSPRLLLMNLTNQPMTIFPPVIEKPPSPNQRLVDELAKQVSRETILRSDLPLAKRTTLRVGGAADLYVEPALEQDLAAVLKFCAENKLPFFVIGRGSNLLIKDCGFRGVAISLVQSEFSRIELREQQL